MKKLLVLFLSIIMVFGLIACNKSENINNNNDTSNVTEGNSEQSTIYEDTDFRVIKNGKELTVSTNSSKTWTIGDYLEKVIKVKENKNEYTITPQGEGTSSIEFKVDSAASRIYNMLIVVNSDLNPEVTVNIIELGNNE